MEKIIKTTKNFKRELNVYGGLYFENEKILVKVYREMIEITDLTNALKRGKFCEGYTIKSTFNTACDLSNMLRNEFNDDFEKVLEYVRSLEIEKTGQCGFATVDVKLNNKDFQVFKRCKKGMRCFSPFNLKESFKPLKTIPTKWSITSVIKALVNNQYVNFRCNGKYTDDYAYDNACGFNRGEHNNNDYFVRELIEDPSGWWTNDYKTNIVDINCGSFEYHSFEIKL